MPLQQVVVQRRPLCRFGGGHARQRRPRPSSNSASRRRRGIRSTAETSELLDDGQAVHEECAGGGLAGDRRRRGRLAGAPGASPAFRYGPTCWRCCRARSATRSCSRPTRRCRAALAVASCWRSATAIAGAPERPPGRRPPPSSATGLVDLLDSAALQDVGRRLATFYFPYRAGAAERGRSRGAGERPGRRHRQPRPGAGVRLRQSGRCQAARRRSVPAAAVVPVVACPRRSGASPWTTAC